MRSASGTRKKLVRSGHGKEPFTGGGPGGVVVVRSVSTDPPPLQPDARSAADTRTNRNLPGRVKDKDNPAGAVAANLFQIMASVNHRCRPAQSVSLGESTQHHGNAAHIIDLETEREPALSSTSDKRFSDLRPIPRPVQVRDNRHYLAGVRPLYMCLIDT